MHLLYYSLVVFLSSAFLHQSTTFCSSQSHCHTSSHHTASQQYSYLNRTTFAAALLFTRSRSLRFRSLFLLLFVLLSGDIELNPGPSAFTLCTLNIRSILHPLHSTALSDLIDTHNPDLFCLTETWILALCASGFVADTMSACAGACVNVIIIIGTVHILCGAGSMQLSGVRPSVSLSRCGSGGAALTPPSHRQPGCDSIVSK